MKAPECACILITEVSGDFMRVILVESRDRSSQQFFQLSDSRFGQNLSSLGTTVLVLGWFNSLPSFWSKLLASLPAFSPSSLLPLRFFVFLTPLPPLKAQVRVVVLADRRKTQISSPYTYELLQKKILDLTWLILASEMNVWEYICLKTIPQKEPPWQDGWSCQTVKWPPLQASGWTRRHASIVCLFRREFTKSSPD